MTENNNDTEKVNPNEETLEEIESLLPDLEETSYEETDPDPTEEVFVTPGDFDESAPTEAETEKLNHSRNNRLAEYEKAALDEGERAKHLSGFKDLLKEDNTTQEEDDEPIEIVVPDYFPPVQKRKRKINWWKTLVTIGVVISLVLSIFSFLIIAGFMKAGTPLVMEIQGSSSFVSSVEYTNAQGKVVKESASDRIGTPVPFVYRQDIPMSYSGDIVLKASVRLEGDIPVELSCRILAGDSHKAIKTATGENNISCSISAKEWKDIKKTIN